MSRASDGESPSASPTRPPSRSSSTSFPASTYSRYLELDPAVLRVLDSAIADSSPDRKELAALADAAKAAAVSV